MTVNFNAMFYPWRYISIKVPTQLDIFFNNTRDIMINLFFYGGLRLEVHPYFEWIDIYLEVGGHPWAYDGDFFNTFTGFFSFSVGVSIDINFKKTIPEFKELKRRRENKKKSLPDNNKEE